MANALPEPDKILSREFRELLDVVSDSGSRRHEFSSLVMGPLAALLVIKWVGRYESERQSLGELYNTLDDALDVAERELDDDELEREQEKPAENRFIESLKEVVASRAAARAKARYVARVAPLLLDVADTPFLRLALSEAGRTELGTPEGRANALKRFDEQLRAVQKFNGESTTPAAVADLMLELARPRPNDRIYDPCFGFGSFLVAAARRVHSTVRTGSSHGRNDKQSCAAIFGVEINRLSYAIGLCRAVLAGIERPRLELGNALDGRLLADGFDCVLATPPWGMIAARSSADPTSSPGAHEEPPSPAASIREYPIRSRHADDLFLQHVMANLRPGGRAVVALPQSTLFRSGSGRRVREALVSGYRVEAVLSLPPRAFAPCTHVLVNLVVFRRDEPRSSVRFVRVSPKAWNTAPGDGNEDCGRGDLQHRLADLVHVAELAEATVPEGVEAWDVSVSELARRGYELVAKRTGSSALNADLDRVVTAGRSVRVERLEGIAEVRPGRRYVRRATTDTRSSPDVVAGLLRLRDVTETGVRAPTQFLIDDSKGLVDETDILRRGDVVVSISGAVGKVGLILEVTGAVGSIATGDMAVVRELRGVTPNFLVALLRSPTYQHWLSGHARGAAVERLSVQTLRRLPIPLPPESVQDAVLDELGGARGDALAVLARLLARKERSPLAVWLEGPFVAQLAAGRTSDAANSRTALSDVTDALVSLDKHVSGRADRAPFSLGSNQRTGAWLGAAGQAAAALDGVVSIPSGAGRLAVLELGRARLHEALHTLGAADGRTFDRLRSVTRGMTRILDEEIEGMQESVTLRIGVEPAEVAVGAVSEVQLRLTNASEVPLRNVRIDARIIQVRPSVGRDESRPPVREAHIVYLGDGETHHVPVTVHPSDATQPVRISVSWRAQRLDGTSVGEAKQVEVRVRTTRETVQSRELDSSPYIVGSPVDRREMFFGRADVMGRITRQLGTHANVILLEGNRRTGKTSILRQLAVGAPAGWVPVYCSLQDAEGDAKGGIATQNVFRLLARTTGWALYDAGVETWFPDLPARDPARPFKRAFRDVLKDAFAGEYPFEVFALYIAAAIEVSSPRRILLMLDEFDKLQEGIEAGTTSPQVPENIRHLLQHQAGLGAIITGSRRLKRLREEYWSALFGLGHRIGISALPTEEARRLVTRPVEGMLDYLPQACERVVELCASQPFLVQSLCNRVFEQAVAGSGRTVTLDIVKEAATEMVRDNEHFRTLWGYAGTERRRLLLMLCERLSEGPDAVNLDLLQAELEEHKVPVSRCDLTSDIEDLRELELIDLNNSYRGGTYRLAVPLMARWLQMNVDFKEAVVQAQHEAIEAR